jgi:nicotinate-nucleotide adenylyltransferase
MTAAATSKEKNQSNGVGKVESSRRIALFGGSFDPPHVAHQMVAVYVAAVAQVDAVWVVPCKTHPLGKEMTAWDHRLAMCRRAFADFKRVRVSTVEAQLPPPNRTVDTLEHLVALHPSTTFQLVVGSDILEEKHRWYGWQRIVALADLFVVGRKGWGKGQSAIVLPQISSSEIRHRLQEGQAVDQLVPRRVLDYIETEKLYLD